MTAATEAPAPAEHTHPVKERNKRLAKLDIEIQQRQARGERDTVIAAQMAADGADPSEIGEVMTTDHDAPVDLPRGILEIMQDKNAHPTADSRNNAIADLVCRHLQDNGQFYHDIDLRDHNHGMYFDRRRHLLQKVRSDEFQAHVSELSGVNRSQHVFKFMQSRIEDEALVGNSTGITPGEFWQARNGRFYVSCGDGHIVRIRPGAVEIVDNGTDGVLFASGRTLAPWKLTDPVDPFTVCRLWRDMAVDSEAGRTVLKVWLLSLVTDQRTKPVLCVAGDVGSGKTRAIVGVFQLFGITPRVSALLERGEDDFWNSLNHSGLFCLDNADTKTRWLPDALAAASTDGCREKRQLYTDSGVVIQRANSWCAVTSANPSFGSDSGLADRLLVIRLHRREMATAESAITDEIAAVRDGALSWIAQTLSKALADTAPTPEGLNRRHPDFADMAVRIGRAMGEGDNVINALRWAETDKSLFNLEQSDVGQGLLAAITGGETFRGTAKDLLEVLRGSDDYFAKDYWTPRKLGKRLAGIWPHVKAVFSEAVAMDSRDGKLYELTA